MPTGRQDSARSPLKARPSQFGHTFLGLLAFVALSGAALASLGQHWATLAQRERERELLFRGQEIRRAIESYMTAPEVPRQAPRSFADLLEDRRGPQVQHHLRRLYLDPFTGQSDWVLLGAEQSPGAFVGVHSRSQAIALREDKLANGTWRQRCVCDWMFESHVAAVAIKP